MKMLKLFIYSKTFYFFLFCLILTSCYSPKEEIESDKFPDIKTFDQVFNKQKKMNLNTNKLESVYQIEDYIFINYQLGEGKYRLLILKNGEQIIQSDFSTPFRAEEIVNNQFIGLVEEKMLSIDLNNLKNQQIFQILRSKENNLSYNDSISKKIKTIYYLDTIVNHKNAEMMKGDRMQWYFLVKDSLSNKFYIERDIFRDSINFNPTNFEWIKQNSEYIYQSYATNENKNFKQYDKVVVDNKWCTSGNHFVASFGYCPVYINYFSTNFNKKEYKFKIDEREETPLQFLNFDKEIYVLYNKSLYYFPKQE